MTWIVVSLLVIFLIIGASSQTLPCQLTGGTSCPTMICPNTNVSYTCSVGSYAGSTQWNVPSVGACSTTQLTLVQGPQGTSVTCLNSTSSSGSCGPFTVTNTPPFINNNLCLNSTLSVTITPAMNGLVVSCSSFQPVPSVTTSIGSATISVVAPPSTPIITVPSNYSDPLIVTWTSVTATSYNVSINGSTPFNTTATTYNITGLTSNSTFTISVVAINCAGTSSASETWPRPTTPLPTTSSSSPMTSLPMTSSSSSSSTTSATTQPQSPSPDSTGAIVGGVVGGIGGAILLAVVVVIVVVVVCKKKGNGGGGSKSKEDRVELQKSGGAAERNIASHDVGAMYQDPNAIKRAEGPAGDMYAMADKPKTKGGAPADGGGALYQDPKDIEHTRGPAGEVYAVADKKPKEVPHQPAPTGDLYAEPSKRK